MILHSIPTGTSGLLQIEDQTDDPDNMTVGFVLRNTAPNLYIPQMPWTYSIDGVMAGWRSYNLENTGYIGIPEMGGQLHYLARVYVAGAQSCTLHLGDTNTEELNGPTDLTIDLYSYINSLGGSVRIRVDGVYVNAIPYVRHEGVWRVATPLVKQPSGWKPTS